MTTTHEHGRSQFTDARSRSMLLPVAFNELIMPSLGLARSSRMARRVSRVLLALLVVTIVLVLFAPWQQSVSGSGDVMAYDPLQREQEIQAPIKGRIVRWGVKLVENSHVTAGQFIAEIQDLDPDLFQRLKDQELAGERQVQAAQQQLAAAERNQATLETIIDTYDRQLAAYRDVQEQAIAVADAYVAVARQKILAEQQGLAEQRAALSQVTADYLRQKKLFEEQIASQLKYQEAERKWKEAQAKVAKADAYLEAARQDLEAKQRDRDVKTQKAQIDIEYATAALRKGSSDISKAENEVAKVRSELTKAEKDLLDTRVKVARQRSQSVYAPFNGFLVQIPPNQGGRIIKEGDPLCVIVPDTEDRAVQIWLRGNDAPLVEPGRHVRLQFEGWPAVQFSGWPSIAVGTFGGEVISVDASSDEKGRFRVLVLPDETEFNWPTARFLKQGVRTNGWVLLEQVPLWFEVWRRLNAFPPTVKMDEATRRQSGKTSGQKSK